MGFNVSYYWIVRWWVRWFVPMPIIFWYLERNFQSCVIHQIRLKKDNKDLGICGAVFEMHK